MSAVCGWPKKRRFSRHRVERSSTSPDNDNLTCTVLYRGAAIVQVLGLYTHGGSDHGAISVSIDSAYNAGNEVEQSEDSVVAQLLYTQRHSQTDPQLKTMNEVEDYPILL